MSESIFPFAKNINAGHIRVMDQRKRENDAARHDRNAFQQGGIGGHGFPGADHHNGVTEVEQVIPDEQDAVDGVGERLVLPHQREDEQPAVAVKAPAYPNGNKTGDNEIDEISQRVHRLLFDSTKLFITFEVSKHSER